MKPLIVFDFAGTLIKPEIIEEANEFRTNVLDSRTPSNTEHANSQELYKINNEYVEKLTGITKDMNIKYTENDLDEISLNGEQVQTQIMTNLFQIGMYMVAKKYKTKIFPENLLEVLGKIQETHNIAIFTGVRTDIVTGMLAIANCPIVFDNILGQPPILGVNNQEHLNTLAKKKINQIRCWR